jgi:hypothetical protein
VVPCLHSQLSLTLKAAVLVILLTIKHAVQLVPDIKLCYFRRLAIIIIWVSLPLEFLCHFISLSFYFIVIFKSFDSERLPSETTPTLCAHLWQVLVVTPISLFPESRPHSPCLQHRGIHYILNECDQEIPTCLYDKIPLKLICAGLESSMDLVQSTNFRNF